MQPQYPWACGSPNKSCSAGDAVDEASAAERHEEILQSLSKLTRVRLSERSLSADFRLQLQLLECSVQQQRLLHEVADQQRRAVVQLEGMHGHGVSCQRRLEHVQLRLEQVSRQLDQQATWSASMASTASCVKGPLLKVAAAPPSDTPVKAMMLENGTSEPASGDAAGGCGPRTSPPRPDSCWPVAWPRPPARTSAPMADLRQSAEEQPVPLQPVEPMELFETSMPPSPGSMGKQIVTTPVSLARSQSSFVEDLPQDHPLKKVAIYVTSEMGPDTWMRKCVGSTYFDLVCAIVITFNALIIGLSTQDMITWGLANVGKGEKPQAEVYTKIGYFFIAFYILELCVKMVVFRLRFFMNKEWCWNVFDLLLVLIGLYDLTDFESGDTDVTWIRLLRLIKMLKMLRVIRVMKFFRVLRMMVSSIAGSMMTLMWSILMLGLMMYVFGLCFLQILAAYLSDPSVLDSSTKEETLEAITMYWASVPQAIITLYYAVTGGADWEVLAMPVREAGVLYHCFFMFYIAFSIFAVLNVLTGLYVDTATKVSEMDNSSVEEELNVHAAAQSFKDFVIEKEEALELADTTVSNHHSSCNGRRPILHWSTLERHWNKEPVKEFVALADISTVQEGHGTFAKVDHNGAGRVDLDHFVDAILISRMSPEKLEMMSLAAETKRCSDQQGKLMDVFQERFDDLLNRLSVPLS